MPEPGALTAAAVCTLRGKRILVIGDLMLDAYMLGDTQRISPEAPVPIVRIEAENYLLGGAGNVACSIAALGGDATLVGITGQDDTAGRITDLLHERHIRPALLSLPDRPTTIKTRIMARHQQMLRLDRESTAPLLTDHRHALLDIIRTHCATHDVIILSDYAKGLLDEHLCASLAELVTAARQSEGRNIQVLVDPKPQHFHLFSHATLLTPNLKETGEGIHMPVGTRDEILAAGQTILRTIGCTHLLSTLGPEGMALFVSEHEVWHIPTVAQHVFDVTGAGDTVIATLALSLAADMPLLSACMLANYAAGIVVSKVGAATASPDELIEALHQHPPTLPTRWM